MPTEEEEEEEEARALLIGNGNGQLMITNLQNMSRAYGTQARASAELRVSLPSFGAPTCRCA